MSTEFIYDWEKSLYQLAFQTSEAQSQRGAITAKNPQVLDEAYQLALEITKENSKTFFFASNLLSKDKRKAIRALYAFCRISDDLVDHNDQDPRHTLDNWHHPQPHTYINKNDLIALAWADARENYEIPWHYSEQLIQGVSQDLSKSRYHNFDELAHYCYGVASTVGLMSMHIIGFRQHAAYTYAIRLGVALQLTNILRDVGEDYRAGRIYLPIDELAEFDLTEEDIAQGEVTPQWRDFMRFQIDRNRQLYAEAKPGIAYLSKDGRFAITAAADLYADILREIEENDYNVFTKRAHTSILKKIKKLPVVWQQATFSTFQ
mgnify:CR=1 FL=1